VQPVPCYKGSDKILPDQYLMGPDQEEPHLRDVPGYVHRDDGSQGARTSFTEARIVPASTWKSDNVLKWSALEIMTRGQHANMLIKQVMPNSAMYESVLHGASMSTSWNDACSRFGVPHGMLLADAEIARFKRACKGTTAY